MGKTHEALERAEKDFKEKSRSDSLASHLPPAVMKRPMRASGRSAMERYDDLKTRTFRRCIDMSIKTILFTTTVHGSGSSTTALNFAVAIAKASQLKVLLVDVNLRTPGLHEAFNIDYDKGISDLLSDPDEFETRIRKVGPGDLHIVTCGSNQNEPLGLFESKRFEQFLARIRERFDYIILDAPPVNFFPESRLLCEKADGVVLVVESGKTRRHTALRAKKQLEESGANILGVVLNRRKFYIPDWIYKRL
jgi:capsular exopolysaccharide synthesis family protein